jgi:succinate dehydrogenase / fumarate reductase cytochrome b subunit
MRVEGRPVYLNLLQIRLPLPGVVSFAHRLSGIILILALPGCLYLLMTSLRDEVGFIRVQELLTTPLSSILLIPVLWSFWHHLLSGIRFLLLDLDVGLDKSSSNRSAGLVLVMSVLAVILSMAGLML